MTFWLLGIFSYCASAYLSYSENAKKEWWFLPLGIAIGAITTVSWLSIAKNAKDHDSIYFQALAWDVMTVVIFAVWPLLFMGVRLNQYQLFGAFLVTLGLILFKL